MNGRPALHWEMSPQQWQETFSAAYADLTWRIGRSLPTEIDAYALENPGEFFAVLSELFFERPQSILKEYPQVHALLREFYRQDSFRRLAV